MCQKLHSILSPQMIFKLSIGPLDYVLQLEAKNWEPLISKKVFAKSLESLTFSTSMQTHRLLSAALD